MTSFLSDPFALHRDFDYLYLSSRSTKAQLLKFLKLYSDNSLFLPQAKQGSSQERRARISLFGSLEVSLHHQILRLGNFTVTHSRVPILPGSKATSILHSRPWPFLYRMTMWPIRESRAVIPRVRILGPIL